MYSCIPAPTSPSSRIVDPLGNPPSTMLSRSAIPVGTLRTRIGSVGAGRASTLKTALSLVRAIPVGRTNPAGSHKALLYRVDPNDTLRRDADRSEPFQLADFHLIG